MIRLVLLVLFYGIVGTGIVLLGLKIVNSLYYFFVNVPYLYETQLEPYITHIISLITENIKQIDPDIVETISLVLDNMGSVFRNLIGTISSKAGTFLSKFISGVPSVFIGILLMIISSVFFSLDYEKIVSFIDMVMPINIKNKGTSIKDYIKNTLFVVLKSYALIMCMTFSELLILFSLFKIDNALMLSAVIAVLDIMPVLGTGGVLIPWAVISFITDNPMMGVKLLVIYGVITVIRNYVEPKIVGAQLGLHPIITLISMFIGLQLFGFIGMFGIPVGISFLWQNYKDHLKKKEVSI